MPQPANKAPAGPKIQTANSATQTAGTAPRSSQAHVFAGTSGWAYPTWKPAFYPAGVSAKKFLTFYASQLNSVEVNYTFTRLPTPARIEEWLAQVPDGFRFSFKAPQRITHFNRLRESEPHLAEFFKLLAPAAEAGKLGLVLFQLPPNFKADQERLAAFLQNPSLRSQSAPPIAFEFRHPTWFTPEINALLEGAGAAVCIADTDALQTPEIHTAPGHTCFRLRRDGGYQPSEIAAFAERFASLSEQREVYAYFRHQDDPTGALNAMALHQALRQSGSGPANKVAL